MIRLGEVALLFELARDLEDGCIVEVGSYRGRSAAALACGALAGSRQPVFAVEPHEEFRGVHGGKFGPEDRAAFYRAMLETGCYRNVRLVNVSSEVVTPGWSRPVGLLFLDGDHTWEGVRRDFRCWEPHLVAGARLALDDTDDPDLGPRRLADELVSSGAWARLREVGKITVLARS